MTSEQYPEYFAEFDKLTDSKMKVTRDEMSIPLAFYIKDSEFILTRSIHPSVDLSQMSKQIFPHLYNAESGELHERFANLQFRIAGFTFAWDTPLLYLYETFKATEGVLHLTVVY